MRSGATSAIVTNKNFSSTTGIVTLTANSHGIKNGDLILVKGVDPAVDGTFIYDTTYGGGANTITYKINKTLPAITSAALSSSSTAYVQVPFVIKYTAYSTYSTDLSGRTYIPLAKVTKGTASPSSSVITDAMITDIRNYSTLTGGVQIYDGATNTPANPVDGQLRWNKTGKVLEVYDGTASTTKILYNNSGSGEVHARLGSTATTAASGDHNHNYFGVPQSSAGVIAKPVSNGDSNNQTIVSVATWANLPTPIAASITVLSTTFVEVMVSARLDVNTNVTGAAVVMGVSATGTSGGTTLGASPVTGTNSNQTGATDGSAFTNGDIPIAYYTVTNGSPIQTSLNRIVKISAGTTNFNVQAYRSSNSVSCTVGYSKISVVPITTSDT